MAVFRKTIPVTTDIGSILDLTPDVADIVHESGMKNGIACVFVPGSTASVTTIEYEDGLVGDVRTALERLFPQGAKYNHDARWHDGNGHSHVRAAFLGPGITVPFTDRRLELGTWQQIVLLELDVRGRRREIIVQAVGE